jgi:hypothetical protein
MHFRIPGPGAEETYAAMTGDLAEAEFSLSKQILADVAVFGTPTCESDGSISFGIEALTIAE